MYTACKHHTNFSNCFTGTEQYDYCQQKGLFHAYTVHVLGVREGGERDRENEREREREREMSVPVVAFHTTYYKNKLQTH